MKTRELRLKRILDLISEGKLTFQIVDILMGEWQVTRRQIQRYLTVAYKHMAADVKGLDIEHYRIEYKQLILRYENMGEFQIAQKYRDMLNKIEGVYKQRMDVTSNGESIVFNIIKPKKDE